MQCRGFEEHTMFTLMIETVAQSPTVLITQFISVFCFVCHRISGELWGIHVADPNAKCFSPFPANTSFQSTHSKSESEVVSTVDL